jgi:hypothetical protein
MVGHILRKDIKLFWPAVLGLAVLQVIHAAMGYRLPISVQNIPLDVVPYNNFGIICTYATQLLIVLVVQQDALVGTRQDWLMRPIARGDMLLAKLIFVLAAVRLPVFICDLALALHHGAALPAAFAAGAFSAFEALVGNDLITFAVATVTENLLQAVICVLLIAITRGFGSPQMRMFLGGINIARADMAWVGAFLSEWITVLAIGAILLVQFFRRKTLTARTLLGATVVLLMGTTLLPWNAAFALQRFFYNDRTAGGAISISYAGPQRVTEPRLVFVKNPILYLPVHVSNVPPHSILRIMNFDLRVMDASNRQVSSTATGFGFEIPGEGGDVGSFSGVANPTDHSITVTAFHSFRLTPEFYQQWKDRSVHLQMRYSMALLRQGGVEKIAALSAPQKLPGYGLCATGWRPNNDNELDLTCFASADIPSCTTITLETDTGVRNPERSCAADFEPGWRKLSAPIAPGRQVVSYFFYLFGPMADRYPVKQEDAPRSHFVLTAYKPVAYFIRDYRTPDVTLANLAPTQGPRATLN